MNSARPKVARSVWSTNSSGGGGRGRAADEELGPTRICSRHCGGCRPGRGAVLEKLPAEPGAACDTVAREHVSTVDLQARLVEKGFFPYRARSDMPEYTISANGLEWTGRKKDHEQPDRAQVAEAKRFIKAWADQTKTIRTATGSYGLKHDAEKWSYERKGKGEPGACGYISNGAFIQAAVDMGIPMKPARPGNPNAFFALSWKRLTKEKERAQSSGYRGPRPVR